MSITQKTVITQFFDLIFGNEEGYICIATQDPKKGKEDFKQVFFRWPQQRKELLSFIIQSKTRKNVWYCVNLLEIAERKKEYCLPTNLVWADLDEVDPETVDPKPPIVIESSPGRYQAIWRLKDKVEPEIAEDYSRRVAYSSGADKSGWDLTQLLRVPLTFNYKYEIEGEEVPTVNLVQGLEVLAPVELFEALPQHPQADSVLDEEVPKDLPNPDAIIYKYWIYLKDTAFGRLHENVPEDDWSGCLWREINICLEAGMDKEEAFSVVKVSKCNKYERDNRPIRYLWRDVLKAAAQQARVPQIVDDFIPLVMPDLVDPKELKKKPNTFVDEYCKWAAVQTDAIEEYHELTAFMLLSSVMAAGLKLNTSYGTMIPNLWGMILGDSTLTRKSTAMSMAMSMVGEIDPEIVLATDGSAEGILTGLSTRPNKVSVFYKDEVSGFFDSINRKDYLAGMPETLTQLYDVPPFYTRRLRKETITVTNPVFIFYGGGIKDKVHELLTEQYILSGFLPRFLIVCGETDFNKVRRTGPATQKGDLARGALISALETLYKKYNEKATIEIAGQKVEANRATEVMLEDKAWERYGDIEFEMAKVASESPLSMLALPTFERLSRSILKMSMLLAASSREQEGKVILVQESDIIYAAYFVQKWGRHSIDMLLNVGRSVSEKTTQKILKVIEREPGIQRSKITRTQHLSKKQMDMVLETLEDRAQIRIVKKGKTSQLWAL